MGCAFSLQQKRQHTVASGFRFKSTVEAGVFECEAVLLAWGLELERKRWVLDTRFSCICQVFMVLCGLVASTKQHHQTRGQCALKSELSCLQHGSPDFLHIVFLYW